MTMRMRGIVGDDFVRAQHGFAISLDRCAPYRQHRVPEIGHA
jgi:hypothetical protein